MEIQTSSTPRAPIKKKRKKRSQKPKFKQFSLSASSPSIEPVAIFKRTLDAKLLDPIEFHFIMGLALVDNITKIIDNEEEKGVFSVVNVNSKIVSTLIEKDNGILVMALLSNTRPNTSWRFLFYRLTTLSDIKARNLALTLEKFCLKIEEMERAYVWKPKACDSICSKEREYSILENRESLSAEIKILIKNYSEDGVYAFVRKKSHGCDYEENIEMIVNQKLCDFVGLDMEEFALACIRTGFPEFISPDSYYEFWKYMFEQLEEQYTPIELKLRTKSGSFRFARTKKIKIKKFFLEGDLYTVIIQPLDLVSPSLLIISADENKEKLPFKSVGKEYEYLHSVLPFMEQFY